MVQLQLWVVVENNTVCLAASIPTLRPLLRRKGAASSSTPAYDLSGSQQKRGMRSRYNSNTRRISNETCHQSNNSEEYILSSLGGRGEQIIKTTDVVITSEERVTRAAYGQGRESQVEQHLPQFLKDN